MSAAPLARAGEVRAAGTWQGEPADEVQLVSGDRHRRRLVLTTAHGLSFLLDLPEARLLREGDALCLEDGRLVRVRARPEPLMEVTAPDGNALLRLAWHLGNRHTPAALEGTRILIRPDHVLAEMVRGLGGQVREVEEPFDPETGAYHGHGEEGGHMHGHTHT
ncbi:urease accessory protein UreE [Afifella sp. IM 167]|uniref:urease accessory protein UreE n=1 Tax=Afifella sp. IM 167 TaxID=2033586 RepID=UPI001CCFFB15|nr:urease accessory protein UreE [Afifella sp. IM 167]MBZ8134036.1 urease accessory protein UreE [Afifella sp. IM 167]